MVIIVTVPVGELMLMTLRDSEEEIKKENIDGYKNLSAGDHSKSSLSINRMKND
jgi:hypothetical protein